MHQSQRALNSFDNYNKPDFALSDNTYDCSYVDVAKSINSNQKDLRILQHNIRGISSKTTELKHLIDNTFSNETPDLVLLCETWLNDNSPILQVPGYRLELTNRVTKSGGGVAILIADNIPYRRLPNPQPNNDYEACFIDVKTKNKNYIVGSVYRPLNTNPDEFTTWLQSSLSEYNSTHEIILGMDHNMDLLRADIHKPTQRFLDCILDAGLMPKYNKTDATKSYNCNSYR